MSVLHKNIICCGYSLETPCIFCGPRRGDSNENPQHVFLWRNKQNYPLIIPKYPPYLFHSKKFMDIPNRKGFCQILQIQTGYSRLNDYRNKLGQCNKLCIFGEIETPSSHSLFTVPTMQRMYAVEVINPARIGLPRHSYPTQQ